MSDDSLGTELDQTRTFMRTAGLHPGTQSYGYAQQGYDISNRVRGLLERNPYMAEKPEAVLAFAQSDMPIDQMLATSGQMYGMMVGNDFAAQLERMSPAGQRATWNTLGRAQQMALADMGYKPPQNDEDHWYEDWFGGAGKAAGAVIGGISNVVSPVLSPVLEGLQWANEQAGHLYRTIRLMDDSSQWLALGGAIIGGAAAAALAPFTGGGSLAAFGALAGGALAGGTAAAGLTNPHDWMRAFGDSWEGERTFDRPSQRRAEELLGDPRLVTLALDVADATDRPFVELAKDMAALKSGNINRQIAELAEIAGRMGEQGSEEFTHAYEVMTHALQDPLFQQAVETLQHGKISIGRDIADNIYGVDQGSTIYNLISGSIDAAFTISVDPTLMLGGAAKWRRAQRAGMTALEGGEAATRFREILHAPPTWVERAFGMDENAIHRYHRVVAKAVDADNYALIEQYTPEMKALWMPLREHAEYLRTIPNANGGLREGGEFTLKHLEDYYIGDQHMAPILRGLGTVRGREGIVLRGLGPTNLPWRNLASSMRSFSRGMTDVKTEKRFLEQVDKWGMTEAQQAFVDAGGTAGLNTALWRSIPAGLWGQIGDAGMLDTPWMWNELHTNWRAAGRMVGHIPGAHAVGEVLTAITTMVPPGRSIALTGAKAPEELSALTELARYWGMPAWSRQMWRDTMLSATTPNARLRLVTGWLDNAMTTAGIRSLPEGEEIADKFLRRQMQAFGQGGLDEVPVINGIRQQTGIFLSEQADEIVMPDLRLMQNATKSGFMAHFIGVVDTKVLEPFVTKIWKPSVLLRIGFIPRAAGEEMVNFFLRGGLGSLGQEFVARGIGQYDAYIAAAAKRIEDLTPAERELLANGFVGIPAPVRPLARMMARSHYTDPMVAKLERVGEWYRNRLRPVGDPLRNRGGIADADRFRSLGGQPLAASRLGLDAGVRARLNVADKANALILGSHHSWRRMLAGGVDDDLLEAARAWSSIHRTALMREVSSTDAGAFDRGYHRDQVKTYKVREGGEVVEKQFVVIRGSRKRYSVHDDAMYHTAVHHQALRVVEDPIGREIAAEHVSRIVGSLKIDEAQVDTLEDIYRSIASPAAKHIANAVLGTNDRQVFDAALEILARRNAELAAHIKAATAGIHDPSMDEVLDGVRAWVKGKPVKWKRTVAGHFETAKQLVDELGKLGIAERRFLGQYLRSGRRRLENGRRFYSNWQEAEEAMVAHARGLFQATQHQEAAAHSIRMSDEFTSGQAILYVPPPLTHIDGTKLLYDEARAVADHPEVLDRNRQTVETLLNHAFADSFEDLGKMQLVANKELADELTLIHARVSHLEPNPERLRAVRFDRRIKDGRFHEDAMLRPIAKSSNGDNVVTHAWTADRETIAGAGRLLPVDKATDELAEQWARTMVGRMRQVWTSAPCSC